MLATMFIGPQPEPALISQILGQLNNDVQLGYLIAQQFAREYNYRSRPHTIRETQKELQGI
jgi:hypothetical protein